MQGIRNAKIEDSVTIYEVIRLNSVNGQLLMVPLNEIRKHISDFSVFVKEDTIVGCGRIYRYNNKISEICSLSVIEEMKGIGIGKAIIDRLIEKAQTPIIFLVTEKPDYYIKLGFERMKKTIIINPKIWYQKIRNLINQEKSERKKYIKNRYVLLGYLNKRNFEIETIPSPCLESKGFHSYD